VSGITVPERTNTPEPWSGGVSRQASFTCDSVALGGVLGGYPLMPVQVPRVVIIGGPEICPEPNRLGLRCTAPDHDAEWFRLTKDWDAGHGLLLITVGG
jgi:hypothetical protein